jgi:hypothetical protein
MAGVYQVQKQVVAAAIGAVGTRKRPQEAYTIVSADRPLSAGN